MVSDAENLHPSSNSAVSSGHTYCMKDKQQQDEDEQVEKNGGNPFVGGAPSWLDNKLAAGAPAWPFPLLDSSSSSSLSPSSSSLSSFSSPWSWSSCLCNSPPRWEGQDSAGLSSIRAPVEEQSEEEGELVEGLVEETEEYQDLPGCNFASVSHPISIACYQSWRNQLSTNSGRLQSQSVFQLDEEEDMDIVQSIFAARSQQFSNPSRLIEDGSIDPQRFVNARQQLEDRGLKARGPIFLASSPVSWESSFNSSMLAMNFLGACFFCHSLLSQGKDIYMYRGDCAFCSLECRYQQIALDELNEKSHQEHFASLVSLDVKAKPWRQL